MQFRSIVSGSMKSRVSDRHGSGQFDASRVHHHHQGLDVVAAPGELALSPIDGDVVRDASPYFPFDGLLIQGTGEFADYTVKLFYVEGSGCRHVTAGAPLGKVQDLGWRYPGITNHIHMEVRRKGKLVPPFEMYHMSF